MATTPPPGAQAPPPVLRFRALPPTMYALSFVTIVVSALPALWLTEMAMEALSIPPAVPMRMMGLLVIAILVAPALRTFHLQGTVLTTGIPQRRSCDLATGELELDRAVSIVALPFRSGRLEIPRLHVWDTARGAHICVPLRRWTHGKLPEAVRNALADAIAYHGTDTARPRIAARVRNH